MRRAPSTNPPAGGADVLVIGDGVIGLGSALAVARAGGSCRILGRTVRGAASAASAGLLASSIGRANPAFRTFMAASRDLYPAWIRWLAERTGIEVTLDRSGIIELSTAEVDEASPNAERLDNRALHSLEPGLAHLSAARLYPDDGYVDNVRLLAALREAVRCEWSLDVGEGRVAGIEPGMDGCTVTMEDGRKQWGKTVVLAAGAWTALIAGAPRPVPVEPVRGQMLLLRGSPAAHAISAPDAYLVPRGETTLVGSTLERVGFDSTTTATALERLRSAATAVFPSLADVDVIDSWAGLRPITPDGLPILGRDPDLPSIVYACGHGKNGILLAPITAEIVAALASNDRPAHDIEPFGAQRFG